MAATAGTDQEAWDGATYVYDGQKDDFGNYFVEEGDVFGVESVTPMGSDTALAPSGYSVFYMVDGGSTKGLQLPYNIHWIGERTYGAAAITAGKLTFTPGSSALEG